MTKNDSNGLEDSVSLSPALTMAAVAEGRKRRRRSAPSLGAAHGDTLGDSALHELSLQLEAEAEALSNNLPAGVTGCRVLQTGLVELRLAPAAVKEAAGARQAHAQDGLGQDELGLESGLGFGSREWPLIVGGEGVGDDPSLAAALGTPPRGPVAVRFGTAVGLDAVDDCGMVDSTFWADPGLERPTLRGIANKALRWLARAPENECGDDASASASSESESKAIERSTEAERWHKAAAAAEAKVTTATTYRKLAVEPRLVSTHGGMAKEWLVPAVADLLCVQDGPGGGGGSGGGMVRGGGGAMAPSESAALLKAAAPEHLGEGIYRFALFTPAFCKAMCDEIDNYEASGLPARRPNTMNNGGLVVNDIGTTVCFDN